MSWNPEYPFEPPGSDPILPRFPALPPLEPNIPPGGVPEDFIPASPYQPPTIPGTLQPSVPSPPTAAPPSAPPSPGTPPISPTPSPSSPVTPSSPPPSSSVPPTIPGEPPVRIWEDHREWSGERRTEPRSRIPIPRTPTPIFEGEWSTRPQPSPVWPIVGVIGRVVSGVVGIFWPSELGNGELTPEQQQEARDAFERNNAEQLERERTELARALREYERTHAAEWPGRYHRPQVEGAADGILEREIPSPAIPDRPVPVPVPELTLPSPAIHTPTSSRSSPTSSSSPSSSTSSPPRPTRARIPTPQPTFGQELLEALLEGLVSGASSWARNRARTIAQEAFSVPAPTPSTPAFPASPFADPLTPPRIPGMDPLTPPRGNPLTSINTGSVGFGPPRVPTAQREDQDRCRCKPKKRKPARKCHAKAGLRWVGGPKNGQLAGSRCYAFTNGD